MKKLLSVVIIVVLVLSFTGCSEKASYVKAGVKATNEEVEVIVFAAASMTESLEEIASLYKTVAPKVKLTFNFDSSGTLKTQIEEGATCDLFISAGEKQIDQLDIEASQQVNPEGLDFVETLTRVNLLENQVALVVPNGNPKTITDFQDMARKLKENKILLSMGNSDVPVGQYTQRIFTYYGLDEERLASTGALTYGTNVKEVTTQVKEGSVDAGVVYCTDAYSARLTVVAYATDEMCGKVIYPAALIKSSQVKKEAQAFLNYLSSEAAMKVFKKVGFSSI